VAAQHCVSHDIAVECSLELRGEIANRDAPQDLSVRVPEPGIAGRRRRRRWSRSSSPMLIGSILPTLDVGSYGRPSMAAAPSSFPMPTSHEFAQSAARH